MPTAIQQARRNDPPYEKNGSGIPVMGMRLIVMPTLMMTCTNQLPARPKATRLAKESLARVATRMIRRNRKRKRTNAVVTPRNPSSSPTTAKMKSVCCSGRNASRFCVPCVYPLPVRPPEPIAIRDCST